MLVADSGATKTEWRLCRQGRIQAQVRTQGFNPSTTPLDELTMELKEVARTNHWLSEDQLYFYSTGTGSAARRNDLLCALQQAFPKATIGVEDDLVGATRCTGRTKGMVAILGTGSNSACYLNGQIVSRRGGLGYLLGDEGSGTDLGKFLLKGILEGALDPEIGTFLAQQEKQAPQDLMRSIYQDSRPQVRLASLARHLPALWDRPEIETLILERFRVFLERIIIPYPESSRLTLDVVGSVGHYFASFLSRACVGVGITFGQAILHPIEALTQYHLSARPE